MSFFPFTDLYREDFEKYFSKYTSIELFDKDVFGRYKDTQVDTLYLGWEVGIAFNEELNIKKQVEYPSGKGILIVPEEDKNGVVIVLDESGEYKRVAKIAIRFVE